MPSNQRKKPKAKDYDHLVGKVVRLLSMRERLDGSTYRDESEYYVVVKVQRSKTRHELGTFAWGVSSGGDAFSKEGQLVKLARAERLAADLANQVLQPNEDGIMWVPLDKWEEL